MYTNLKSVQYLIAGLKAYDINTVVVSPGNSHNAIVRSLEEDDYFKTYNIVDERSAAFFACGLEQELKKPIAICCTAGTAASNYLSGVTEAFRRELQIVVITGDKNPYYLNQYEDQMIDNMSIFSKVVKCQRSLPIIKDIKDEWYCQRVINEALLELNHNGSGPVHINVPIEEGMLAIGNTFSTDILPPFKKIDRYDLARQHDEVAKLFGTIRNKRILIECGQDDHISSEQIELMEKIADKYNCIFAVDKLSNLHCKGTIEVTRASRRNFNDIDFLMPDIVIALAGNPCMDFKFKHKSYDKGELWVVNSAGRVADPYKKLSTVFQGSTIEFLREMAFSDNVADTHEYYSIWRDENSKFVLPEFAYSNLYCVNKLMNNMPQNSVFNIANSTTIRIAQYFDLDESIKVFCNRGVNGIDGCVSTFIGQAAASDQLNFLVVGDLTFFYDMNSVWNRYVGKNVRIMLCNNEGAALFHFNQGVRRYPTLNENVAAEHFAVARGWVENQDFIYLSAKNKDEFDEALEKFICEKSEKPIFFEVFTHKDEDAKLQREFFDDVTIKDAKESAKKMIGKMMPQSLKDSIRNIVK